MNPPNQGALWLIRACLLAALGIALFLGVTSLKGDGVPGCGPESECDRVLSSRWASLGGLPVSLLAAPIYLALLVLSWQAKPNWKAICALGVLLIAEAAWFVGLQFFVLRAFCKFCMAAHIAGVIAAVTWLRQTPIPGGIALRWGTVGVALAAVAAVAQVVTPQRSAKLMPTPAAVAPASAVVEAAPKKDAPALSAGAVANTPAVAAAAPAPAAIPEPVEEFAIVGGQFKLKLNEMPVLGVRGAPKKVVKLFDYTCHHCRDLHHHFEAVLKKYPNSMTVISLPVPLEPGCNPLMRRANPQHQNACEYARLGLAVFYNAPEKLHDYDAYIFGPSRPPAIDEARAYAGKLIGKDIAAALADARINTQLNLDIQIYAANSRVGGKSSMPQLIFADGTSIGHVPTADALESILRQAMIIGAPL